jgi:hypothetical protein
MEKERFLKRRGNASDRVKFQMCLLSYPKQAKILFDQRRENQRFEPKTLLGQIRIRIIGSEFILYPGMYPEMTQLRILLLVQALI